MNRLVDSLTNIEKREDEDLRRFADFLFFSGIKEIIVLDKPDETRRDKVRTGNFDYLVQLDGTEKIAIEFTQIFEKEEKRVRSMQWGNLVGAFRDELKSYLQEHGRFNWIGVWNVETPEDFGASRNKSKNIARKSVHRLIEAIEREKSSVEIAAFVLKFRKAIQQPRGDLFFSTSPKAGGIDPSQDIEPKLREKLPEKNQQLAVEGAKRVLIIVNKYIFGETNEVISALSRIDELWKFENFDRIYFEESPSRFVLVFSDKLRDAWNSREFSVDNAFVAPFQLWISHLCKGDPVKTFSLVKKILTAQAEKPHELLPDNFARQEIIQLGNWLVEQRRFEDAIWLIDRFIEDPDPGEPGTYRGVSELDYHERLSKGEDPNVITTVLGYLAWVVQKLSLHKEHLVRALAYTNKLLSHKNLYVKHQAIVPLIETAARRQWLDSYGKRPYQGSYKEFHDTVFGLVKLVEDHPDYRAITKWLSHVFRYYKDLTTEEAKRVLDALKTTEESAMLFVYFGIFRQRHFKDQDIEFSGDELKHKLLDILITETEEHTELQARIAWCFWKILKENLDEFDTLKPYIDLLLKRPYRKNIFHNIELIVEDTIEHRPSACIYWFELILDQVSDFIASKEPTGIHGDLWLVSPDKIMMTVAVHRPDKSVTLMEKLVYLWKKGVYVRSPTRLFETFKLVSEKDQRTEIKGKFRVLYNSMKKLDPRLEEVDWQ